MVGCRSFAFRDELEARLWIQSSRHTQLDACRSFSTDTCETSNNDYVTPSLAVKIHPPPHEIAFYPLRGFNLKYQTVVSLHEDDNTFVASAVCMWRTESDEAETHSLLSAWRRSVWWWGINEIKGDGCSWSVHERVNSWLPWRSVLSECCFSLNHITSLDVFQR